MKDLHLSLLKVLFLLIAFNRSAAAQELPKNNIKSIIAASDSLQREFPAEKIYLHTDKPSYNIGDTIWFKAYVFDAAYLSGTQKSDLVFVELHNDSAEVIRRISIKIKDGIGYAQIPLIKEIFKEGGYTLRAYTSWTRNFGLDYVFSRRFYMGLPNQRSWLVNANVKLNKIANKEELQVDLHLKNADQVPVGLRKVQVKIMEGDRTLYNKAMETSVEGSLGIQYFLKEKRDGLGMWMEIRELRKGEDIQLLKIPLNVNRPQKIDLQFLPEGGNLVTGLKSTVGFKAIGENGAGIDVAGAIYDGRNQVVCGFESLHKGKGAFAFTPKPDEIYTARLSKPEGNTSTFNLPVINATGTVLHMENPENQDSLALQIKATIDLPFSGNLYLIGASRGVICYAQTVDLKSNRITIAKNLFPTGIARFTLLSDTVPLNERIVFIDHQDALKIDITTSKPAFYKRDSVELEIAVKDKNGSPVMGSFSLAVTDNAQVTPDHMNNFSIGTSLLLNANLKGSVEEPGFYLQRKDTLAWKALDHLMLTQGWTGYDWRDVFSHVKQIKVEGDISNDIVGKISAILFPKTRFKQLMPWYVNGDHTQLNYIKNRLSGLNYETKLTGIVLKEVKITSKKINYNGFNLNGIGQADIVLDTGDINKSATKGLYDLLKQKIPGLYIAYGYEEGLYKGYQLKIGERRVIIRLNNAEQPSLQPTVQALKDKLNIISVYNLTMAEIMYTQKYLNRYYPPTPPKQFKPGEQAQIIKSYSERDLPTAPPTGEQKLYAIIQLTSSLGRKIDPNPLSIMSPLKFYSPKYKNTSNSGKPDLRSTIYWEPNIVTDVNGKAKVSFYAADAPGSYAISLEGCDLQGGIGNYKSQVDIL